MNENTLQTNRTTSASDNAVAGLRGLACLLVVLSHCYRYGGPFTAPVPSAADLWDFVPYFFGYGYIGVDLFFVVSGFVLGKRYLVSAREPVDWREYYRKRVLKILPLFYGTVIPLLIAGLCCRFFGFSNFLADAVPTRFADILYGLCLVSPLICGAYWTLCIQLRWYLVFPLLILLVQRIGTGFLYALSVLVSVAIFFVNRCDPLHDLTVSTWWQTLYFLPEFVLGILLADLDSGKWRHRLQVPGGVHIARYRSAVQATLATLFVGSLYGYTHLLPNYQRLDLLRLAVCTTVVTLLFFLCKTSPLLVRIVTARAAIFVGTISYSVYLVHEPIIRQLRLWTEKIALSHALVLFVYMICVPLLVLCAGAIWFRCAERRLGRRNRALIPNA